MAGASPPPGGGGGVTFLQSTTRTITRTNDTSNISLDADTLHLIENDAGSITADLPDSPADGTQVVVVNGDSDFSLTVSASGSDTLNNRDADLTMSNSQSDLFEYDSDQSTWYIAGQNV